jgi:vancomycin resistance protein YoaR
VTSDDKPEPASESSDSELKYASNQSKKRAALSKIGKISAYILIAACGIFLFLVVMWRIDVGFINSQTPHNVRVAGINVSKWSELEIQNYLKAHQADLENATVVIHVGNQSVETTPKNLGLTLETELSATNAKNFLRDKPLLDQFGSWIRGWTSPHISPLVFSSDQFGRKWFELQLKNNYPATEPQITYGKDRFVVNGAKPGFGIGVSEARLSIAQSLNADKTELIFEPHKLQSRFSTSEAKAVAKKAERFSGKTLSLTINGQTQEIDSATYKKWFKSYIGGDTLALTFDRAKLESGINAAFPKGGTSPKDAVFSVDDGVVNITPEQAGTACCDDNSVASLKSAVFGRGTAQLTLVLRTAKPAITTSDLQKLGVKEPVGTFTTRYHPGQPRVHNIHLISDLIRGQVIQPGKTFSVNKFVGRRTTAKGFVVDHAIENGKFVESVGGGISQFATTSFNAAFFAGLEIPEYQAHSIYISRYPYGREATLSYPHPDLKLKNITPYGVLIWPTYDGSSVTVTLYSTQYATGAQTNQTTSQSGNCTVVRTERTRTFAADGKQKKDYFRAVYQPKEGVLC